MRSFIICTLHQLLRAIKSRRMRQARHIACMQEERDAYKTLVRKTEGKRPLGTHRYRWEDNIKMDLTEIGSEGVYWTYLLQNRVEWQDLF
jgi:hypothetical protein